MSAEILTVAESYQADRYAEAHGVKSLVLMENAGRATVDAVLARFAPCRTIVLCGPGNNGGDGYVAARLLKDRGWDVAVARLGDERDLKGDAAEVAKRWKGKSSSLAVACLDEGELIIDALFGAGLSRAVEGVAREVVAAVNASSAPVVAVDIPSGLSGDTGTCPGDGICVHADLTVTFFRLKPAHALMPGRIHCGETIVADIGIPDAALDSIRPRMFLNGPALWRADYPWPHPLHHKYARGHAVIVSGPLHATGAARLAARGALRIGAGLVSVASPEDAVAVNAAHLTAIMVKPFAGSAGLASLLRDTRLNAVGIGPGCGVGKPTADLVGVVLASGAGAVLDADALTSFAHDPSTLIRQLREPCVLTPHAGEFARIFPGLLERSASRVEAVREASRISGCSVLLKGPDTAIAEPSGRVVINSDAPAWLATAGSGDVLTGFLTGLMAQGMRPFHAACAGVWLHGRAASLFGPGLISEDISELLPAALSALEEPPSGTSSGGTSARKRQRKLT